MQQHPSGSSHPSSAAAGRWRSWPAPPPSRWFRRANTSPPVPKVGGGAPCLPLPAQDPAPHMCAATPLSPLCSPAIMPPPLLSAAQRRVGGRGTRGARRCTSSGVQPRPVGRHDRHLYARKAPNVSRPSSSPRRHDWRAGGRPDRRRLGPGGEGNHPFAQLPLACTLASQAVCAVAVFLKPHSKCTMFSSPCTQFRLFSSTCTQFRGDTSLY